MLKKLFITTPDLTREGDNDASQDSATPRISHEQSYHLEADIPDPALITGKKRQYPADLSPPTNAKRVSGLRENRLRDCARPTLLTLPVELRLVIFTMILGDRKVHVHYKRGLQSNFGNEYREVNER